MRARGVCVGKDMLAAVFCVQEKARKRAWVNAFLHLFRKTIWDICI